MGKKRPQAGVVSAWGVRYEKGKMLVLRRRSSDYFGGVIGNNATRAPQNTISFRRYPSRVSSL